MEPHAGWSGYIKVAARHHEYETSAVIPLPFVNLEPTNLTTINTCVRYAAEECQKRRQKCIVTFDQPLFIKAVDIVSQADETDVLSSVIVRLGGLHLLMSYMGAVGRSMGESGLEELWEEVYAKNALGHLVIRHWYARALRAHSLSQAAIAHFIFEQYPENGTLSKCDVQIFRKTYCEVFNSRTEVLSKVEPLLRV